MEQLVICLLKNPRDKESPLFSFAESLNELRGSSRPISRVVTKNQTDG